MDTKDAIKNDIYKLKLGDLYCLRCYPMSFSPIGESPGKIDLDKPFVLLELTELKGDSFYMKILYEGKFLKFVMGLYSIETCLREFKIR